MDDTFYQRVINLQGFFTAHCLLITAYLSSLNRITSVQVCDATMFNRYS